MGRTLHFGINNSQDMTDEDKDILVEVSDKYNSGELEKVWTCESFYFDPYNYYPNWTYFNALSTCVPETDGVGYAWEFVCLRLDALMRAGFSRNRAVKELIKRQIINQHDENGELRGFCKTGSNEYNSMLVFLALVEISVRIPRAEICLSDEGEFLLGDLIIQDGKVKFNEKSMKKDWDYWKEQGFLDEDKHGTRAKMELQQNLLELYPGWFESKYAIRPVNSADFKDHPEYGAAQIMAGFYGEYWNLSDNDGEAESYKMLEMITGMMEKAGFSRDKIQVVPKLEFGKNV